MAEDLVSEEERDSLRVIHTTAALHRIAVSGTIGVFTQAVPIFPPCGSENGCQPPAAAAAAELIADAVCTSF